MAAKTQVNSSTGIMGPTGAGKSSLAATLADYLWERWHKVLLYYVSDGGGYPAEVQARIAIGIIRVFRMQTRDPGDLGLAFETCYRAAQGWWPKRINPATGEVEPGVEMIPPIAKVWDVSCSQGHLMRRVQSQNLIAAGFCQQCGKAVPRTELQVTAGLIRNKGFEDVGAVFFDGLTSMLGWELRELGHRAGRLELKGEEAALGGKVTSGDLKFGGVTRSHVGFAQTRGEELVHLALGIPNLMVPPVFTMLTHEDVDDRSLSIRGPKIAGRAKTDEAPQWFGNMLEVAKIPALQGSGEQRVLYLNEFTDQNGVKHLLKHRGSPGTMPDLLADPPGDDPGTSWSQVNLGVFFRLLDQALDARIERAKEQFPDAPGLPDGIVEYGDAALQVPKAQAPVPAVAAGPQTMRVPGGAAAPAPRPVAASPAATPAPVPVAAPAPPAPTQAPVAAISGPGAPAAAKPKATRKAAPAKGASPAPAPAPVQAPAPVSKPNGQGESMVLTTADIATVDVSQLVGTQPAPVVQQAQPAAPSPTPPARPAAPPQMVPPRPAGAPSPRPTAAPPAGARPAAAPPPGQRPPGSAPIAQARPPVATATGPLPAPSPAAQTPPPLRPAGVTTSSTVARPQAAAPRPPAAAPRPPAPTPRVQ